MRNNDDWSPYWLMVPAVLWVLLIICIKLATVRLSEPMPVVALPDPHVPACYRVEGIDPSYCEFRVRSVH